MLPIDEKQLIVKKSNDLIEARYKLSVGEQRLILLLASQIHKDDKDFDSYEIRVSDFAEMFRLKTDKSLYEKVEQAAQDLLGKKLFLKNDSKNFEGTVWLSYVKYIRGSGTINLRFDDSLKPYLLQLKDSVRGFTKYQLETVMNFKSSYSIRLYELLKMEVWKTETTKKKQFEKTIDVKEYRNILGIPDKKYKLFSDLRKWVIEPTIAEVSDQTDLNIIEIRYNKIGKTIVSISFIVLIREQEETKARQDNLRIDDIEVEKPVIHPIMQALMDNGFSFENAKTYKTKYGIKRISRNLAYMKAEQMNGKKIENKAGYLTTAIKEDWGEAWESEHKKQQEEIQKQKKEAEEKEAQAEKRRLEIKARYDKTLQAFYALDEETRQEIETEFKEFLAVENTQLLKYYQSARKLNGDQWGNTPQIKITFVTFLMTRGF